MKKIDMQCKCSLNNIKNETPVSAGAISKEIFNFNDLMLAQQNTLHVSMFKSV